MFGLYESHMILEIIKKEQKAKPNSNYIEFTNSQKADQIYIYYNSKVSSVVKFNNHVELLPSRQKMFNTITQSSILRSNQRLWKSKKVLDCNLGNDFVFTFKSIFAVYIFVVIDMLYYV